MPKKRVVKKSFKIKSDDSKVKAFVATFFSIFGFLIALIAWKDDDYVMYYAKQSLVLFLEVIIVAFLSRMFFVIPIIGLGIYFVLNLVIIILWVLTWIYALSGEKKRIPFVSDFAGKFNL